MEARDNDNTAAGGGGGESETESVTPNDKDKMEESAAKFDPVNEPGEAQHSEKNDESTGGESEMKSVPSTTSEKGMPELTIVLIGDTNSIETGSKNILLDYGEQANVKQFSTKLYDLCGRHISVINMLGLQNTEEFPLNQGIHAFVLLLANGLHTSHYSSGVQWLEEAFGKGSLSYLMTAVTHESDEKCEGAFKDLKANSSFVENRFQTCTRSLNDEKEIIALLEKIDVMVSENDPHCYSGLMCERMDSSAFQQNQTVEEMEEDAAEINLQGDPVNEHGDVKQSEKPKRKMN
ncbi:uncharacterized protein LOC127357027 isoform X2 [Dicentrarchus labrax]|uniref:uncharacterized protein LOC127357027 isoform X2 n=1 Tax=Dicentrarchus labrax TaxID=13489 RepID=UPI0021F62F52|nr:uncharacterized protein LOC127357027 isoform X2 [Dicentrarchus labrax]